MTKNIIIAILCLIIAGLSIAVYNGHKMPKKAQDKVTTKQDKLTIKLNKTKGGLKGYLLATASGNSPLDNGELYAVDMQGNKVFSKKTNHGVAHFKQLNFGNKIYYAYGIIDTLMPLPCVERLPAGHIVLLDSAFNELKQIHLIPNSGITRGQNCQDLNLHGMVLLSENHFITMTYYIKQVNNIPSELRAPKNKRVASCLLQESINGNVVWQWDATNYPELYSATNTVFSDTLVADYIHANSILIDPKDSNLLLSCRNLNQVLKINRKNGQIIWRLGGKNSDFPLTPQQCFMREHGLVFEDTNKTLVFIDNGDIDMRPYSRVVEFRLDEKNKKVESFKGYKIPHNQIQAQGNVTKQGGNYLISGGMSNYLLLVNPDADEFLFDLRMNMRSYMVEWVEDLYGLDTIRKIKS